MIGRVAATASLDLHLAGVRVDEEGKVVVDEADRTSTQSVYAIGDVARVQGARHTSIPQRLTVYTCSSRGSHKSSVVWSDNMSVFLITTPVLGGHFVLMWEC